MTEKLLAGFFFEVFEWRVQAGGDHHFYSKHVQSVSSRLGENEGSYL